MVLGAGRHPCLSGLRVLRPGLALGSLRGGIFRPAHALALWTKAAAACRPLAPEEAAAYLAGETLPDSGTGWQLVTLGGLSMGWGKAAGGQLKNHYPKGLRRR